MPEETLNEMMEFDHVIRINPDLSIDTSPDPLVYAPESVISTDSEGQIMAEDEKTWLESLASQGWEPLDGYSSQCGYSGPIMHASEYIGGHMEEHIRDHPGLYVVTSVECLGPSEDSDPDEPAGWVVLFREIELPHVSYRCPCCGDDVIGTQPVCSDCELAGCERSQRGGNDRDWYNCRRTGTEDE